MAYPGPIETFTVESLTLMQLRVLHILRQSLITTKGAFNSTKERYNRGDIREKKFSTYQVLELAANPRKPIWSSEHGHATEELGKTTLLCGFLQSLLLGSLCAGISVQIDFEHVPTKRCRNIEKVCRSFTTVLVRLTAGVEHLVKIFPRHSTNTIDRCMHQVCCVLGPGIVNVSPRHSRLMLLGNMVPRSNVLARSLRPRSRIVGMPSNVIADGVLVILHKGFKLHLLVVLASQSFQILSLDICTSQRPLLGFHGLRALGVPGYLTAGLVRSMEGRTFGRSWRT